MANPHQQDPSQDRRQAQGERDGRTPKRQDQERITRQRDEADLGDEDMEADEEPSTARKPVR